MVPDIFHRDFTPTPFWWEAHRPEAGELENVPRETRVAIVGGGYAGLSAALELTRSGIDAVVLEANELGFGASTRNGGAVSGGVNVGKSFTGKTFAVERNRAEAMLSDASDAFALIDRLISEESIDCFWEKPGRFVWARGQESISNGRRNDLRFLMRLRSRAPTSYRASGNAKRSPATIILAAWSSSGRGNCIHRYITRACSMPAGAAM